MLAAIPGSGLEHETPRARVGEAAAADAKLNVHGLNCGPLKSANRSSSPTRTRRLSTTGRFRLRLIGATDS
jgi:hypothetical protein